MHLLGVDGTALPESCTATVTSCCTSKGIIFPTFFSDSVHYNICHMPIFISSFIGFLDIIIATTAT